MKNNPQLIARGAILTAVALTADQLWQEGGRRTAFAMRVYGAQLGRKWELKSQHLSPDLPPPAAIPGTRAKQAADAQAHILKVVAGLVRGTPATIRPHVAEAGQLMAVEWGRVEAWEKIRGAA